MSNAFGERFASGFGAAVLLGLALAMVLPMVLPMVTTGSVPTSHTEKAIPGRAPVPPWAVPVGRSPAAPTLHSTHYWAGEYYSGTAAKATHLATTIRIPDANPNGSEFYYVLLSVWDNAGSYDQVGFTNDYGFWGFAYSYTSACAGTYYYSPNHYFLTRGASYTFMMNLSNSGNITFALRGATGKYLSTLTRHTGGTTFVDQATYTCSGATYYDLTDYEEIYTSVQPMPSFDFFFKSNVANSTAITAWSSMGAPPGGGIVTHAKAQVEIENEAFWLAFNGTGHVVSLPKNSTSFNASFIVHNAFAGGNVSLRSLAPSGWTVTFAPSSGRPGFNDVASISIGPYFPKTPYFVGLETLNATGAFSYLTLQLSIA